MEADIISQNTSDINITKPNLEEVCGSVPLLKYR